MNRDSIKIFEKVIIVASSRFIGSIDFDIAVNTALSELGTLCGASRANLFLLNEDKSHLTQTHEWSFEEANPQKEELKFMRMEEVPWWMEQLKNEIIINITDTSELIYKAKAFKEYLKEWGIKSLLAFPIKIEEELIGYLSFENIQIDQEWGTDFYSQLAFFAEIIGNAINQKRAEEILIDSEKKYRKILEDIKEGYFEIDLNGDFTFLNEYFSEITGYSNDELLGRNYNILVNDENKDLFYNLFNHVYKTEVSQTNFQAKIKKRSKEEIFVELSSYLIYDKDGKKAGFFGIVRDITERKKDEIMKEEFEEQLKKQVEIRTKELNKALKQQKLYLTQIQKASRFKTEFLSTMSHELRTPLNAILGFCDLLIEQIIGELNEEQLEFLDDIKSSAEHLFEMINNILDISKIEAGQSVLNIKKFSINNIMDQVKSALLPLYNKKGLKLKLKGLDEEKEMYADPIKFKEILLNLVSNAIKFTMEGKITVVVKDNFKNWIFQVRDPGIGIDSKDFDIIFKEFRRVDSPYVRSTPGSGLGLSLTKRLIESHGGEINFTSVLGVGTVFTFTIPKKLKDVEINN
jgi:PAS domain S-box-containing protein